MSTRQKSILLHVNPLPRMPSVAVAFLLAAMHISALAAVEHPPNFVVILCDNLGYGDIEPFGSRLNRTPALQRMAKEGRRFDHFYVTAGVCTPSRASLMTGCYAQRVGMHVNSRDGQVLRPLSPFGLAPAEITIAEVLSERGYRTALVGKWHLGDQPEFLPTRQGFDEFFGIPYSDDMTQEVGQRLAQRGNDRYQGDLWPPLPLMHQESVIEAPADRNTLTQRYTQQALDFISQAAEQPFFLLLSHAMPGSTTTPFVSEQFRGRSRGGAWGDSVEEIDWSTGRILDRLAELGIAENTLVIWTSDNGAPLSSGDQPHRGTNAPLHGRGYTTSEGAFRVPMLAWWPGHIPAASVCKSLCSSMDVLPTLAALSGQPITHPVDGFDIRRLLFDENCPTSPYPVFCYYEQDQLQAVRSGVWKLFLPLDDYTRHPHFTKKPHVDPLLFNVVADPACVEDLAAQQPAIIARLTTLAEERQEDLGDRGRPGSGQRAVGEIERQTTREHLLLSTDAGIHNQ